MSEIKNIQINIEQTRQEIQQIHDQINELIAQKNRIERLISKHRIVNGSPDDTTNQQIAALVNQIRLKRQELVEKKTELRALIVQLNTLLNPENAIQLFNQQIPILLFPVKIETKYFNLDTPNPQLWIRIFPDDICIDTFENQLTEEEVTYLEQYYQILDGSEDEKELKAWQQLVEKVGVSRAAYLQSLGDKYNTVGLKPHDWSNPPQCRTMPDFFEVRLYHKEINNDIEEHVLYKRKAGRLIPSPLVVGPNPISEDQIDNTNFDETAFGPEAKWLFNPQEAEDKGMLIKVDLNDLSPGKIEEGFSRVMVLGIRTASSHLQDISSLESLVDHHHYTNGLKILPNGIPTNNTTTLESAYNSDEADFGKSLDLEVKSDKMPDDEFHSKAFKTDGEQLSVALGMRCLNSDIVKPETEKWHVFDHVQNADDLSDKDASSMLELVWYGVFLPYLNMYQKMLSEEAKDELFLHFKKFIRSGGSLSAIQVDEMPYGIMPVSSFQLWQQGSQNNFYADLLQILKNLFPYWKSIANDTLKVPRIGGTTDPDKEMIEILGMEPTANNYNLRSIVTNNYLIDLLQYSWSNLFSNNSFIQKIYGALYRSRLGILFSGSYNNWLRKFRVQIQKDIRELEEITSVNDASYITNTMPWGKASTFQIPIIKQGELSTTDKPFETIINNLLNNNELSTENSLLNTIIKKALKSIGSNWQGNQSFIASLEYLKTLSGIDLDRNLKESIDVCAHRLDAWICSLFNKKLFELREKRQVGIYLGAYGFTENLKPKIANDSSYIHAPSAMHGVTAAVLKNAYLSHADGENPERMSINLTSNRVRKALWLLDGIRQGQAINVLLGYRFERNLHEHHKDVNNNSLYLDKFIYPFRQIYPLNVNGENNNDGANETIAPENVVDGYKLLEAWRNNQIPYGSGDGKINANSSERKAIEQELVDIEETFDAIGDLSLSESVYQAVHGNYMRSGAALNLTSADGNPPDEFGVSKTPKGGINLKNNFVFAFNTNISSHNWAQSWRSEANPVFNNWAGSVLGNPEKIIFFVETFDCNSGDYELHKYNIKQIDVCVDKDDNTRGLAPIDLVFLASNMSNGSSGNIDEVIRHFFTKQHELLKDSINRIITNRHIDLESDEKSLWQMLQVAKSIFNVFANGSFLKPQDFNLPEDTEGELEDQQFFNGFTQSDFNNTKTLVDTALTRYIGIFNALTAEIDKFDFPEQESLPANVDIGDAETINSIKVINAELQKLILYDTQNACPKAWYVNSIEEFNLLIRQALAIKSSMQKQISTIQSYINKINELSAVFTNTDVSEDVKNDTINELFKLAENIAKKLFGKPFVIFPQFKLNNTEALKLSITNNQPLNGEKGVWAKQLSKTHPIIGKLDDLKMYQKTYAGNTTNSYNLTIAQLPYAENRKWLGLPLDEGLTRDQKDELQGSLSIAICSNVTINLDQPISGIVLDKWDETIPFDEDNSSLIFNFDTPANEAPQTCLLCVSPLAQVPEDDVIHEEQHWEWEHLVKTIEETMDLMKIRAVDNEALDYFNRFLPGLYLKSEYNTETHNVHFEIPKFTLE